MAGPTLGNTPDLADAALENLVNQFARPLDFLRELVQNSIDAGTPRVEVWLRREGDVLEIHVDDFGDGMDEAILDNQLTRLFSSTKEADLTKIGKFGIGFTSIFAIEPDAVLLHTGRHGESWELLFHPDRSYDKVRLEVPVEGTRITLYKRMDPEDMPAFVREARWVLGYWCEHTGIPITFADRTDLDAAPVPATADVFAAFEDPDGAPAPTETINGPFALDADLVLSHQVNDVHVLLGFAERPSYGFYNGGLTLVSTANPDVLGDHAERLGHLSFKVRCDALEHTLTRDNVLRDAHWEAAIAAIEATAVLLRQQLLTRIEGAVDAGEDLDPWHAHLALECLGSGLSRSDDDFDSRPLFLDLTATPRTWDQVRDQGEDLDRLVVASDQTDLDQALLDTGLLLLPSGAGTRALLGALAAQGGLRSLFRHLLVVPASAIFVLPQLIGPEQLSDVEDRLLVALRQLLRTALGRRLRVALGDFGGPDLARSEPLFVEGPDDGEVFQRRTDGPGLMPVRLRRRCMLINRHDPYLQLQLAASTDDLALAAYSLAQALLDQEDLEGERTYVALTVAALEGLM